MEISVANGVIDIPQSKRFVFKPQHWDKPSGEVFRGDLMLKAMLEEVKTGELVAYVSADRGEEI